MPLTYIYENYVKRFSIKNFNGNSFGKLNAFEQIIDGDNATYYLVDNKLNLILVFNDNWRFLYSSVSPYPLVFSLKYVTITGHLYFSSESYLFETDLNFNVLNSFFYDQIWFRHITINNGLLWVASRGLSSLYCFDPKNISQPLFFTNFVDLPGSIAAPLISNGFLYIGGIDPVVYIVDISKKSLNTTFFISKYCFGGLISHILFDSYGNMALSCSANNYFVLYNKYGEFLNFQFATTGASIASAIDSKGRYIILDSYIEIYY